MEEENTWKLSRFEDFIKLTKRLALDGSNKYAAGEPYKKEAIDIITDVMGEEGYTNFVLGDLLKIALWSYLLWMRLFPKQEKGEPGARM
jgi:hypothetical protein